MKALQLVKFFIISVPLACLLYIFAHTYFEIKRLCGKK
jgi:hypothetical protein